MKIVLRSILLSFALFLAAPSPGQPAIPFDKIDGEILSHRAEKAKLRKTPSSDRFQKLKSIGIRVDRPLFEECAVYLDAPLTQEEADELAAQGIRVNRAVWVPPVPGKHPKGFHLAEVDYSSLDVVRADSRIHRLESTEFSLKAFNNVGAELIRVADVRNGVDVAAARDGSGVNIAVADSGVDLTHADFPTPIEAFDMTDGTDPGTWGTSVANTVSDHGTHVTGTVLGRGTLSQTNIGNGGGAYSGAAPGANLYFYKIGNDTTSNASLTDMIEAMDRAADVGCDIFSMSYGGWATAFLDGGSSVCQAVDAAVAAGVTVFIAAGNDGARAKHDSIAVAPGQTSGTFEYSITNNLATPATAEVWIRLNWRDDSPFDSNVSLACLNLATGETLVQAFAGVSTRNTEGKRYVLTPNIPGLTTKSFQFTLTNSAGSGSTPLIHLYSILGNGTFLTPDSSYTIAEPALADDAIAVGAWVHRIGWMDFTGTLRQFAGLSEGTLAGFSSRGPRVDGLLKPDIVAPGAGTISTRDSALSTTLAFRIDDDGETVNGTGPAEYYIKTGTSMACPMAAGAAALLIEEDPSLTPAEVYSLLTTTASHSGGPNSSVGYGLIDAVAALNDLVGPTPTFTPTHTFKHTPTETPTFTHTQTPTLTPTFTASHTPTETETPTETFTGSPTATPTWTETPVATPTDTFTATFTPSWTPSWTLTPTPSFTPEPTATWTEVPASVEYWFLY